MKDEIEVYEDGGGKWRWRAVAKNGEITATSGESFDSRGNAERAADRFRDLRDAPGTEPEERP